MKLSKVILIILCINSFFSPSQSSQENILNNLFNQLEQVNNSKNAILLEKKIWSIWKAASYFLNIKRKQQLHKSMKTK